MYITAVKKDIIAIVKILLLIRLILGKAMISENKFKRGSRNIRLKLSEWNYVWNYYVGATSLTQKHKSMSESQNLTKSFAIFSDKSLEEFSRESRETGQQFRGYTTVHRQHLKCKTLRSDHSKNKQQTSEATLEMATGSDVRLILLALLGVIALALEARLLDPPPSLLAASGAAILITLSLFEDLLLLPSAGWPWAFCEKNWRYLCETHISTRLS